MTTPKLRLRGCYQYLCNGTATDIEESWALVRTDRHTEIVASRVAPSTGTRLEVRSRQTGNVFTTCELSLHRQHDGANETTSAHYRFNQGELSVAWQQGNQQKQRREPAFKAIFSPLMRIYTGPVIRQLAERGATDVCVPWIRDPNQREQLLLPQFSERQARSLGPVETEVDGQPCTSEVFEYSGGEYQPGTHFRVDNQDVLLRYSWQQDADTCWEVNLRDYQREA
jgi:hypothetical protein